MMKNCSNCDSLAQDVWLLDSKPGGSIGGHNVRFTNKYDATYGFGYRVDPGVNNPKRIDGFVANNTNFNLGKGNNGKYYGFRFDPVTLAVVFYENIGAANEVKTGEIKMLAAPVAPTASVAAPYIDVPAAPQVSNAISPQDEVNRRKKLRSLK